MALWLERDYPAAAERLREGLPEAALLETEKQYRRLMGYRDLWMLKAHRDAGAQAPSSDAERMAG